MNPTEQKTTVSEAVRKHKEFLFPAVATYYQEPVALTHGEGEYVWDEDGNKYLDCFGGVLTVSVGHANPTINAAVIEQINKISHTSGLYVNPLQSDFAEKLAEITPGNLKKSFFTSSGTEADDTAILAAKLATGRQEIVVLRHSYSGRSATALVGGRAGFVATDWGAGGGNGSRRRAVLLPLSVQIGISKLRRGLRDRHRKYYPNDNHRRNRGVYG